jgi:hypothetical protein
MRTGRVCGVSGSARLAAFQAGEANVSSFGLRESHDAGTIKSRNDSLEVPAQFADAQSKPSLNTDLLPPTRTVQMSPMRSPDKGRLSSESDRDGPPLRLSNPSSASQDANSPSSASQFNDL